ncbi:MAG: metallophosphoesterase [Oscillospiraceae bacterium]|jgi:predicted phosphodiesterase|nr:metallophosphoesterase [Oscillospiraceae bacterium]
MSKKDFVKKPPNKIIALVIYLFTLISIAAPVIQWAFKVAWVFIDHETKMEDFLGLGLAQFIFFLMIANALFAIYALVRYCAGWRSKIGNIVMTVLFVLSSLLGGVFQFMNYVCSVMARPAVLSQSLESSVPWVVALIGVPFLLLVWSSLNMKKTVRMVFSGVIAVLFAATMVTSLVNPGAPKLLAGPIVLDTGTGEYSIVFATDKETQGLVRYTYKGVEKEVYSADTIVRRIGRIHAVRIPREELENNSYTIFARDVKYGLVAHVGAYDYGKTVQLADAIDFAGNRDIADPKIISISDWHEQMSTMKLAVDAFNTTPDLVLLLGDYCNYFAGEDDVINTIIGGAFDASGGKVPCIFVRGNHEVRGNYMELQNLDRLFGLDKLYYEVVRGDYIFTVLDSAETSDWDYDNWEHIDQYEASNYYARQIDWLENREPAKDGQYRIVLTHDRKMTAEVAATPDGYGYINMPEADKALDKNLQQRYQEALIKLDVHLTISGHSHWYGITNDEPWEKGTLTQILDGGLGSVTHTGKTLGPLTIVPSEPRYTASLITFQGADVILQGKVADSPNTGGTVIDQETFTFRKIPVPAVTPQD